MDLIRCVEAMRKHWLAGPLQPALAALQVVVLTGVRQTGKTNLALALPKARTLLKGRTRFADRLARPYRTEWGLWVGNCPGRPPGLGLGKAVGLRARITHPRGRFMGKNVFQILDAGLDHEPGCLECGAPHRFSSARSAGALRAQPKRRRAPHSIWGRFM